MNAWSIVGNSQKLDGGAMFGNAPKALWTRWATADDRNRIDLACRALLLRGDETVLLEAGIGAFFEPRLADRFGIQEREHVLLDSLRAVGVEHTDVDVVVLSHLHFDHAGGLLSAWSEDGEPELLFPNATFVVGARHWERANHPHSRDRASFVPRLNGLLAESGRLELVEDTSPSLPGWRFHTSDGHTPGLLLAEVPTSEGPLVFAADLIPGVPWIHAPITMGYDRFPEQLIDEKVRLLTDLVHRGGRLFFTHDPTTAVASVGRDERGRFVAKALRESLVDVQL
ncbi:MAG: MBL fold metallo-hydrolase [Proteobacteria bacterium]|nr:MBL fold metallo-hydrolase [Pseudomonadota bacterium]MCP4915328.1 MBL fold metallo-hydrolase [Pseudomonadota bacterium]